jgi:energy-coupling factor transporter ATP-binding protein EcfA2
MAKEISPPKVTGGGGFGFEDKVVAYFLTCLLVDEPPLDARFGTIRRIDFQTRVDGWHLDDILLTLSSGSETHRCALSVKSNQQFSVGSAPSEFVLAAWETFLEPGATKFDRAHDLLGLTTSPLDPAFQTQLNELLAWSVAQDNIDLPKRIETAGFGSELKRSLFKSFACPEPLASAHKVSEQQIGELLRCVQHLTFDFDIHPSQFAAKALRQCRAALVSGDLREAGQLWDALCSTARDYRPNSGFLDLHRLLDLLRSRFRLKGYPQHARDWLRLQKHTYNTLAVIPDQIGGKVQLPRDEEIKEFRNAVSRFTALIGPSGCGKTVLAKRLAEQVLSETTVLWFNAQSFDDHDFIGFESNLRLQHRLGELLTSTPDQLAYLVIDGLDHVFEPRAFANAATLIKMLRADDATSPWRVIITCQPEEWSRVQVAFAQSNLRAEWKVVEAQEPKDLNPVWAVFPNLERLARRPELRSLLLRPNVLDLLATRIDAADPKKWVGESDLIEWLWQSVIAKAPRAALRSGFVNALAEKQGDELRAETSLDEFNIADRAAVDELVLDRICRTRENRVAFYHDRFGDWGRQRVLLGRIDQLPGYLAGRTSSPSWHPAIRLLGLHLLEQYETVERWREVFASVGTKQTDVTLEQDLLLESVIFAATPKPLLDRLWPELAKDKGKLLKRLLKRFLHVATLPNPIVMATAEPTLAVEAATMLRLPYWPYWLPMISFLQQHQDEIVDLAPREAAEIADEWLRRGHQMWLMRREAAELGLAVGKKMLKADRESQRQ